MFWGNIVALFAVIPILGVIAALVGGIMELIAIVNLRKQSEKCVLLDFRQHKIFSRKERQA